MMNKLQQAYMMAAGGKWIQSAIKRPGAFTQKAKAAGMGVQEYANKVTSNPDKFSTRTKKQANLAKTLKKIRKGQDGMEVDKQLDSEMMEAGRSMQTTPTKEQMYAALPQEKKASTLYDAVTSYGMKGDFASRKKLFNDYFGGNYQGTAAQNTELLKKINSGEINLNKLTGVKSSTQSQAPSRTISNYNTPSTYNPQRYPNLKGMSPSTSVPSPITSGRVSSPSMSMGPMPGQTRSMSPSMSVGAPTRTAPTSMTKSTVASKPATSTKTQPTTKTTKTTKTPVKAYSGPKPSLFQRYMAFSNPGMYPQAARYNESQKLKGKK
jgi:hypothetical protein